MPLILFSSRKKTQSAIVLNMSYDPYWDCVTLLMHMDGSNSGTSFPDEKGHSVSRFGNVYTMTGTKKFGTASAQFNSNTDYLGKPVTVTESVPSGHITSK
jgi:hypothetical protein